jgi:hypothetical protein
MVLHTWTILRAPSSYHDHRMLLHVVSYYPLALSFFPNSIATNIPSPGIYAVMTLPVLNRTLAIFLSPEFGFLGFVVPTFKHTPLSSGRFFSCGERSLRIFCDARPLRRT